MNHPKQTAVRSCHMLAIPFMVLLLILGTVLPDSVSAAASLPKKQGLVQDTAGMIPKESIFYIKQAAQGQKYTYYLLTVDSFEGEEPSTYATNVYRSWELTTDEILIVLSMQERRVEMNFNNAALRDKIDALPDDYNGDGQVGQKLSEFVDAHFIPEAKKGNFARAAIRLMQATENLKTAPGADSPEDKAPAGTDQQGLSNTTSPSDPSKDASSNGVSSANSGTNSQVNKGPSLVERLQSLPWSTIALVILISVAAVFVLLFFYRLFMYKRLMQRIPDTMSDASKGLGRVQTYSNIYQGNTLQEAKEIEVQLTDNLIIIQKAGEELRRIKLLQLLMPSYKKQYKAAKELVEARNESNNQQIARIAKIEETEKELVQGLQTSRERMQQLERLYRAEQHTRSWSLIELEQRGHQIIQQLQNVDDMDAFDPVGANELMNQVQGSLEQYNTDVKAVPGFAEKYRQFADTRQQAVQKIESIVNEHRLKLIRIDPYGTLDQAQQQNEQMLEQLKLGRMAEVAKLAQSSAQLVADAVQMTIRIKELKLRNEQDIETLQQQVVAYSKLDLTTQSWSTHAEQQYRKKHWENEYMEVHHGRSAITEAQRELARIRHLSSEEIQEYEEAHQMLDLHLRQVQEQHELAKRFESLVQGLDQSFEQSRRLQGRGDQALDKGMTLIVRHGLVRMWSQEESELSKLKNGIQQMMAAPPYDVELLADLATQYQERAERYLQQVEYASAQKKNAEREIQQLERRYQSTYRKANRKIHVSRYQAQHASIMSSVNDLMRRGSYDQAAREVALLAGLISTMDAAYQSVLAEERRIEEVKRAEQRRREQEAWNNSSNSSGGSSWGSSHSSNSSGGSSWGSDNNNNNQSSGGSNW